jgi:hypothetical protein
MALFNKAINSYGPDQLNEACEFLGLSTTERRKVLEWLRATHETLAEPHVTLASALESVQAELSGSRLFHRSAPPASETRRSLFPARDSRPDLTHAHGPPSAGTPKQRSR